MMDLCNAYKLRPFSHHDKEYMVPTTGPFVLLSGDFRFDPRSFWAMSSCSIHQVDAFRTGSPTNVANESVFLMNSDNETDVDEENEDSSPAVSPYAYAHPIFMFMALLTHLETVCLIPPTKI